jgi:hypothetical protein
MRARAKTWSLRRLALRVALAGLMLGSACGSDGETAGEMPEIVDPVLLAQSSDDLRIQDVSFETRQILIRIAPLGALCGKLVTVSVQGEATVLAEDVISYSENDTAEFSPAGDRVAYIARDCPRGESDRSLKVVDSAGGQAATIAEAIGSITVWTPTDRIMFSKDTDAGWRLWEVSPYGTDLREVTSEPVVDVSRDGTTFAYFTNEVGLYLDAPGGDEFQALGCKVGPGGYFSPDGRRYVFYGAAEAGWPGPGESFPLNLVLADLEDRSRRMLLPEEVVSEIGLISAVQWSPNGEVLLLQSAVEEPAYAILVDASMPQASVFSPDGLGPEFFWRGPLLVYHGGRGEIRAAVLDTGDVDEGEIEALRNHLRNAFPQPIVLPAE